MNLPFTDFGDSVPDDGNRFLSSDNHEHNDTFI